MTEAALFSAGFAWTDDDGVADVATPVATPEPAVRPSENHGVDGKSHTPVASVALWREAVAWMRTNPQPPAIYATSWSLLCDDADDFVATWGADAVALGWSTEDVFGAHPDPAARRLDTQGLVTLLQGRPVQSLDRWTATIGSVRETLTHTRYPKPKVCVPVWMVQRQRNGQALGRAGDSAFSATPTPRPMSSAVGRAR